MPSINVIALRFDLDSNDMKHEQFLVAEDNKNIVGFGRLFHHPDTTELGTIGVVEEYRGKGVAKLIIAELLAKTKGDVYLTTLIPGFFKQFGFVPELSSPPNSMIRKAEWCDGCKQVGCTVMKRPAN